MRTASFRITGMDCADEIAILRREVGPLAGGEEHLAFDLLSGKMTVTWEGDGDAALTEAAIQEAVERAGMRADPWPAGGTAGQASTDAAAAGLWTRHGRAILCAASGLLLAGGAAAQLAAAGGAGGLRVLFGLGAGETPVPHPALALYLGAMTAGGWFVVPRAVRAARRLRPDMNLLMTVAVLGALLIGQWLEAAAVTFLFSLALLLESWSVERARRAIQSLLELSPATAQVLDPATDRAVETPVAGLPAGTRILVPPGERIPLDGVIDEGATAVNQAPITGESVPVDKAPGDAVYAGTINGDGAIEIRSTRAATDTTVARIIRLVEEARSRRAPSEQWVERFARYYTPAMMNLALVIAVVPPLAFGAAWSVWFYQALVLLVIACPCALVISTPVSIVAALASAARSGVLIRGGQYLEIPARLAAVALDKTGTLTSGRPEVHAVVPLAGHSERELIEIAAAIEARSKHPLATAIVRHAAARGITPRPAGSYVARQGKGAEARLDGRSVWIGSHRLLEERGQEDGALHGRLEELAAAGSSVVVVGTDEHVCGFIALADRVRPEARAAIAALRDAGVGHIVMLTGDNQATAEAVAREVGVDAVRAELLPEDKVRAVEELLGSHGPTAMLGDGVNDAPALASASAGIAMGAAGSDAAIETADIALMSDDLSRLPWVIHHSHRTLAIIKQNITAAIGVKVVFVILTFTGHASLWAAIGADMGISLLVVLNALRLLHLRATGA